MSCLGLLFADFLAELGLQTKALTLLPSFFYISFSPVGLFANYLFNRFSVRSVGIFGAVVFCVGSLLVPFVRTLNELLIAYSILQGFNEIKAKCRRIYYNSFVTGLGFGLVLPAMYTTFNQYFVQRRVMMMGMVGTLFGIGSVILPILIEKCMHEYGFRGCMAILGALNLHVLFGMIAMHPVKYHHKVLVPKMELNDKLNQPLEDRKTDSLKKPIW